MDRRISIRNGEMRYINGDVTSQAQDSMDLVIVNAAPISRSYFSGEFDPDKVRAPKCWSANTQTPAEDVPEEQKQSGRCMDCPQNVRGSGSNGGRACRFSQRLAVAFEDDLTVVYRLQLPATSIYGRGGSGHKPLQEYVKLLAARGYGATTLVTRVYLDKESVIPKLYFKPVRSLSGEELEAVEDISTHADTIEAIQQDKYVSAGATSPFGVVDGFELDAN